MRTRDIQIVLHDAGYYGRAIDDDFGPATRRAIREVLDTFVTKGLGETWPENKQGIAAVQALLNAKGFEAGVVDGLEGRNTKEAYAQYLSKKLGAPYAVPPRVELAVSKSDYPRQRDLQSFYGPAGGASCTAGRVQLPTEFLIAWDKKQSIKSFACHYKVAGPLMSIFEEAHRHYGTKKFVGLGLNIFGGCYNYRNMRGGSSLSTHAYGIAVDLDPENNQLRWGKDRATFAKPVYDPFWAIVESKGAVSLGRTSNMDWMHFQFARL